MTFKVLKIILLHLILSQQLFAQSESGVVLDSFSNLVGSWKGTVKYLDFETDKYISDSVEMIIYRIKSLDSLTFLSFKPNETTTTSVELVVDSKGGKLMDDKNVKYKYYTNVDSLEIINPSREPELPLHSLRYGISQPPNPRLKTVFTNRHYGLKLTHGGVPMIFDEATVFAKRVPENLSLNNYELRLKIYGWR